MPGSIADRLRCLAALALRSPHLAPVARGSALRSCLTWYGPQRAAIARALRIEPLDERFVWVSAGAYGLAWPRAAPLERLLRALIEIRVPGNPHAYFDAAVRLRDGDTVLDVGACEGAFALEAIVRHGAAKVVAFEPDPEMADALRLTAARQGLATRIEVAGVALSDRAGRARLARDARDPLASHLVEDGAAAGAGLELREVELVTLDAWLARAGSPRIDFVKIDAEGADLDVLRGGRATLARWRPRIAVTTYHRVEHCREIMAFLDSLGLGYRMTARGVNVFEGRPRPMMVLAWSDAAPAGVGTPPRRT